MENSTVALCVLATGVVCYVVYRYIKGPPPPPPPPPPPYDEEVINRKLELSEIVSYFRSLSLQEGVQTPFLCVPNCDEIKLRIPDLTIKEGYVSLFAGVYNEKNDRIERGKLIHAEGVDEKIAAILSKRFVTLK